MVTDIYEDPRKNGRKIGQMNNLKVPILLLLNKIDLSDQKSMEKIVNLWKINYLKHKFYLSQLFIN